MSTAEKYLKPEVIRQVARLDLRAKFIVEGETREPETPKYERK